ncbi:MAG TPA: serine hydrolase [Conexibacter sp.]|jgi:D-alanyl-D-alanine carboxypeptidase (penicillin-binding protein 5/6)|nr:serine hydrolase [Conexibacter sp.]
MLRCYELAHIVGVSKTTYVLATPRCLDWRRDLQRTGTNGTPPYPIDHRRRLRRCGMSKTPQARRGTATLYGRRRRRVLLGAVLALALAATAFAAPHHLLNGEERSYLSTDGWPLHGQGAYVLDDGRPAGSPHQQPVPIASVAKVMTAYIVLKHHPLRADDSGPRFVVGQDDVVDTEARRRDGQSVVDVRAGEQLTERDALMAILLPSANNVAVLVARQVSGSIASFVAEMNDTARALGMSHTTYTDPSGYDVGTVSTALDQLRLARVVANDETLAAMMATRTYWLPVAGEVTNTNALLGHDGFVGMKTGSHEAAGGCLMFRVVWPTESGSRSLIGVVLGQRGDNLITAGLGAAEQLVDRLAPDAAPTGASSMPAAAGRLSVAQPGLATPPGTYRPHIENHIRAGNTPLP